MLAMNGGESRLGNRTAFCRPTGSIHRVLGGDYSTVAGWARVCSRSARRYPSPNPSFGGWIQASSTRSSTGRSGSALELDRHLVRRALISWVS